MTSLNVLPSLSPSPRPHLPWGCSRRSSRTALRAALLLGVLFLAARFTQAQTTHTVTDTSDSASDTGSLRYAVNQVNAGSGGDTINFARAIGTITLTNGPLAISKSVTITGPGANVLTISGNDSTSVFTIATTGVSISGLTIANGAANIAVYGGGISIGGNSSLTVANCTFANNSGGQGGGISVGSNSILTVQYTTFSGNSASNQGGGIYNLGSASVENSTFFSNAATGTSGFGGGAIYTDQGSTLTVTNSTIYGNTATGTLGGGGINSYQAQNLTSVGNNIIAGNTGSDCGGCTQSGPNMIGGTPNLGPLQYNGGPTKTMLPLPGSPAILAASPTATPDQRGFARPFSLAGDLGAVETNYLTVNTLEDLDGFAGEPCTGTAQCSLRQAIGIASSNDSGDIIFKPGLQGTITLTTGLGIHGNLNIQGPGASKLTISDNQLSTVFIISPSVTVAISGLTIANGKNNINYASGGGGMINSGSVATIENCSFSGNASTSDGGAIIQGYGTLMVENSTFVNNNAVDVGGGILNGAILVVNNSTFFGNTAFNGGAIYNSGTNGGSTNYVAAIVNDSTVISNTAGNQGGGIATYEGNLTLKNSVLADNVSAMDPAQDCYQCGTQNAANLISTPAAPITVAQLELGPLAYNGPNQTVQTFLPLPGSPLIQAGNPALLPYDLTTDERGLPRTTSGKLDFGAVETNYTSIQFKQQPTDGYVNVALSPAVTVSITESGANAVNVQVPITFNGNGILSGSLTQTTTDAPDGGAVAGFADLNVNAVGSGDTLETSVNVTPAGVTPAQTLTATSDPFNITVQSGPPANIAAVSGSGQSATVGTPFTDPLVVSVQDANGNSVPNITVAFSGTGISFPGGATASTNSSGQAQVTAEPTSAGSLTVIASVTGVSTSASFAETGTAPVTPGFTLIADPTAVTLSQGQTGTATFTVTPQGNYSGNVSLSCNGMPANSTCSLTPASVVLDGTGKAMTAQLTIVTQGPSSGSVVKNRGDVRLGSKSNLAVAAIFWLPGLLLGALLGLQRQRLGMRWRQIRLLVLVGALAVMVCGGMSGCGGGSSHNTMPTTPVTPLGTYSLTVTATSAGAATQTAPVVLTVVQ